MNLNYVAIGKRMKTARNNINMTQETLAELTEFSVPHISHIENGKTKLSLPAIVAISNVLGTTVDELLCDNINKNEAYIQSELLQVLSDCSRSELKIITNIVSMMKAFIRENHE